MATAPPRLASGPPQAQCAPLLPQVATRTSGHAHSGNPRASWGLQVRPGLAVAAPVASGRVPKCSGVSLWGGERVAGTAELQTRPHAGRVPPCAYCACPPVSSVLEAVCLSVLLLLPLHSCLYVAENARHGVTQCHGLCLPLCLCEGVCLCLHAHGPGFSADVCPGVPVPG